jgi:hypothetical protein
MLRVTMAALLLTVATAYVSDNFLWVESCRSHTHGGKAYHHTYRTEALKNLTWETLNSLQM